MLSLSSLLSPSQIAIIVSVCDKANEAISSGLEQLDSVFVTPRTALLLSDSSPEAFQVPRRRLGRVATLKQCPQNE